MFKEIPVNSPCKNRRPVFGVGINDAPYKTQLKVDGKRLECPFYSKWHGMLKRAYYQPYKDKNPTYKDVTVCNEWLTFSSFKAWMSAQDYEGKELDKDILIQDNKVYSPERCVFVTKEINALLVSCTSTHRMYKAGVCVRKDIIKNKFKATCSVGGKQVHLGYYSTEDEAHGAYCKYKYKVIADAAASQDEPVRSALLKYKIKSKQYKPEYINVTITKLLQHFVRVL